MAGGTDTIGVVNAPATPWLPMVAVVLVALVAVNVVAWIAGRPARRISAAEALRSA